MVGRLVVYVDDLLVLGEERGREQGEVLRFRTSEDREGHPCIGQGSYTEELVARHNCGQTRPVPMSAALSSRMADFSRRIRGSLTEMRLVVHKLLLENFYGCQCGQDRLWPTRSE